MESLQRAAGIQQDSFGRQNGWAEYEITRLGGASRPRAEAKLEEGGVSLGAEQEPALLVPKERLVHGVMA